jgi:glycosyltransferase involved in cell wall biosynthesis
VTVSIVIPTYNKLALLRRTLRSLEQQDTPLDGVQVLVVDDGSTDGTAEFLAAVSGPLRVVTVRQADNRGRAAARNAALRKATGDLVVFLDDDMEVNTGFVAAHVAFHAAGPARVGIGNVVNAPEVTDSPIVRYMSTRGAQKIGSEAPLPWRYFSTNNSSVPRARLEAVGFFDEDFKTYGFEDLELGYRLHRAGLEFQFVPDARSLHIHYHDLDDVLRKKRLSGRSSLQVFLEKHPEAWGHIPMSRFDSPFGRILVNPVVYHLLKPLARIDAGWLSDRVFDYLVLHETLGGLAEARRERGRAGTGPAGRSGARAATGGHS